MVDIPPSDPALDRVVAWFELQDDLAPWFAGAIRQSFDEVFDGQRTGRYSLDQLSKVEKTYIGTKIEIVVQAEFGLSRGTRMDYLVVGEEVDAKWSMRSGGWMIPTEAFGELCLCITADDAHSVFSVGLVRADLAHLRPGENKDKKRGLSPGGLSSMRWLAEGARLAENLLLHLDPGVRNRVLDPSQSGQARVNELFRAVPQRVIRREVVLTVAQQDDGPKRVRDARKLIRQDGFLILGHQNHHPRIAQAFGLEVPPKGSWISCRVVPADGSAHDAVLIHDTWWRLAAPSDPPVPGPRTY